MAIVGAAFVLSWAAEAFEKDVSQALALALLALIAVLPEYAVDMVFAWNAASDPAQASVRRRQHDRRQSAADRRRLERHRRWSAGCVPARRKVSLERGQAIELAILLAATLYAFTIPFRAASR